MALLSFLLSLAQDNPLLFAIVLFNMLLGVYIAAYFGLYLHKRRHPEIILNVLIWKTQFRGSRTPASIADLYECALERLRRERILFKSDGRGKLARDKSLKDMDGEKKKVFEAIYAAYEEKNYGNKPIKNEEGVVRNLFSRVLSA